MIESRLPESIKMRRAEEAAALAGRQALRLADLKATGGENRIIGTDVAREISALPGTKVIEVAQSQEDAQPHPIEVQTT